MGDVVGFPANKAGAPPPGALEAEVLRLRRIAARAYDIVGLAAVLEKCPNVGPTAVARVLRAHLMAE